MLHAKRLEHLLDLKAEFVTQLNTTKECSVFIDRFCPVVIREASSGSRWSGSETHCQTFCYVEGESKLEVSIGSLPLEPVGRGDPMEERPERL